MGASDKEPPSENAIIDHLAEKVFDPQVHDEPTTQSRRTKTGLPVEDQVRKEWSPKKGGLPTFFA